MYIKFIKVLLVGMILLSVVGCSTKTKTLVVGAKDFTEQDILGNILQVLIEENTTIDVEYKHEMSSNVLFSALKSGDVDVSIDYTGTVYAFYLGNQEVKSAEETFTIAAQGIQDQFKIRMLEPLGFNNTYTLSVTSATADKYQLKTYSDLAKISAQLKLGATFEILNRNDGIPNLKQVYNMEFLEEKAIDGTLRYIAINNDEVQIVDAFSTDGLLIEYNLVVLEDDLKFFPPYQAVPLVREDTLKEYPELLSILNQLTGVLDDASMRQLNYQVDVKQLNPTDVARAFLQSKGLIK
jgi:osmoprotectant transport system permease protein